MTERIDQHRLAHRYALCRDAVGQLIVFTCAEHAPTKGDLSHIRAHVSALLYAERCERWHVEYQPREQDPIFV